MNKILFGLLAGVLIGIAIAPDKGSATIRKLKNRLDEYKDQASDEAGEWAGKASDILDKGKSKVKEALD